MAEFFKNNPIALRHCLLYEFFHGKSVGKAFKAFCKTAGDDLIEKKEFVFWFDQFSKGIFNTEKEPVTDIKDVLRNDKYALRACVLYESFKFRQIGGYNVFLHHPSFVMYKNFCKLIGEDAMKYREFDFWFYRFLNGEMDLDFERDEDKKIYELSDMPIDILKNVMEYLDIFDRMALMKASRSLRLFTQQQRLFQHSLTLNILNEYSYIYFGSFHSIRYRNDGNKCIRKFKGSERIIQGVSHWRQALTDFKQILNNPKLYLDTLEIDYALEVYERKRFDELESALTFNHQVQVERLVIHSFGLKPLLKILQSVHSFHHCKEFHGWCHMWTGHVIRQIKEILLKSPYIKKCTLNTFYIDNIDTIQQELGEAVPGSPDTYHYSIPDSNEYFEIKLEARKIEITRKNK